MQNLMKNNKGFLLVATYFVLIFLLIWEATFFLVSANENRVVKITNEELSAQYAAEEGLTCAVYEIKSHFNWFTHYILLTGLLEKSTPPPPFFLDAVATINDEGVYVSRETVPGTQIPKFEVKTYKDPLTPDSAPSTIVLTRGNGKGISRLFATRVQRESLFDHFIFVPDDFYMGAQTFQGLNDGNSQAYAGNVIWTGETLIKDISNFSTPGSFQYLYDQAIPPDPGQVEYNLENQPPSPCNTLLGPGEHHFSVCSDSPNITWSQLFAASRSPYGFFKPDGTFQRFNSQYGSGPGARYSYLDNPDLWVRGSTTGLLMESVSGGFIPWDGSCADGQPCTQPNYIKPWEYPQAYTDISLLTNYYLSGFSQHRTIPMSLLSYGNDAVYPINKYDYLAQYGVDPYPINNFSYLDSIKSPEAWERFLREAGLLGVLNDANSGITPMAPKTVSKEKYRQEARADGIFVTEDTLYYNNQRYTKENNQFKIGDTVVAEIKDYYNPNTGYPSRAVVFNVRKMDLNNLWAHNGIFFAEGVDLAIENAGTVPHKTTFFADENFIAKGSVNWIATEGLGYEDYDAVAVIARLRTYLVSQTFEFSGRWQAPLHDPRTPYASGIDELNWQRNFADWMPNIVQEDNVYNLSLIGNLAFMPETLERWGDHQRIVAGALVKLPDWNLPIEPSERWKVDYRTRYCNDDPLRPPGIGTPCRNDRVYPLAWPAGMTSTQPNRNNNIFSANPLYIAVTCEEYPPGDEWNFAQNATIELNNTVDNFNLPCTQIHYNPAQS